MSEVDVDVSESLRQKFSCSAMSDHIARPEVCHLLELENDGLCIAKACRRFRGVDSIIGHVVEKGVIDMRET